MNTIISANEARTITDTQLKKELDKECDQRNKVIEGINGTIHKAASEGVSGVLVDDGKYKSLTKGSKVTIANEYKKQGYEVSYREDETIIIMW